MNGELWWSPQPTPFPLGTRPALCSSFRDQRSFEFRQPRAAQLKSTGPYRQALAERWLRQAEQHNPTVYGCLRSHMETQQRQARAGLTRAILLSGTADKFQAYLWFAWSGNLPKELRKKATRERLGVIDDAAEGWRQETIKLTAEIIQHGSKKIVTRAEQNARDADRHWQAETGKLRRMGWSEYVTGKARQQRRNVAKAAVWRDASEASWEKAHAVATWHDSGKF